MILTGIAIFSAAFGLTAASNFGSLSQCRDSSSLALTFDDGPSAEEGATRAVLNLLQRENIRATFFVSAQKTQTDQTEALLSEAFTAGHTIGSHGYKHPKFTELAAEVVSYNVKKADQLIRQIIGTTPRFFRLPFGETNATIDLQLKALGKTTIGWTISTQDYNVRNGMNPQLVVDRFKEKLNKSNGTIGPVLLLHDIHPLSVQKFPEVFAYARAKGLKFVSMEECTGITPYTESLGELDFDEVAEDAIGKADKEEGNYSAAFSIYSRKDIAGILVLATLFFAWM